MGITRELNKESLMYSIKKFVQEFRRTARESKYEGKSLMEYIY